MTGRLCRLCRGHSGSHFHWCLTVGGLGQPGTRTVPAGTAHLGHFEAPASEFAVSGVPVVEATSVVLCPECLGDWCDACNHTGMALPSDWQAPAAQPLGDGRRGEDAPAAGVPDDLATAVARWCTDTLTRKEAA